MKVSYKANDKMVIEFEVNGQKDLFEKMAELEEVLSNTSCGKCKNRAVFQVREVDDNKFYELRCTNPACNAILAFGAHKVGGTIFPKRYEEEGSGKNKVKKWLPNGGWTKYNAETGKRE